MTASERKQEAARRLRKLADAIDNPGLVLDGAYAGVEVDEVEIDTDRYVQDVAIVTETGTRWRLIDETIVAAYQLPDAVEAISYDRDGAEISRHREPLSARVDVMS